MLLLGISRLSATIFEEISSQVEKEIKFERTPRLMEDRGSRED
jgi:hypothetical protein